jgi:glycosyltransferase involved in cell wall biosynthesis
MKLLQILPSVDPEMGGTAEGVLQMSMQLETVGNSVDVATVDDPAATFISGYPLNVVALGPSIANYRYSSRLLPWLRANVDKYDAVIVNGIWQYPSFAAWLALRRSQVPYYAFPHGMLDPWFKRHYPLKHAKKWLYWPWADYRVLRDARAVLYTSEEERRLARQSFWLYRANERIAPLGIALPPASSNALKDAFLRAHPQLRGRRVLLFMSRLHEKKGCDLLIQSFSKVGAEQPEIALAIAGPDPSGMLPSLQSLARRLGLFDRICWPGMLQGNMKWGALYSAEAFMLPSHQENFGIAVAEALSCALPVLISDKVNIWREIATDGAGLVAPDTLEGTAANLRTWLSLDVQQRCNMSRQAAISFQRRFSVGASATALLRLLQAPV